MSMADPIAIGVETLRVDSGCSLEKEFTELIRMNPWMVLYLKTPNRVVVNLRGGGWIRFKVLF